VKVKIRIEIESENDEEILEIFENILQRISSTTVPGQPLNVVTEGEEKVPNTEEIEIAELVEHDCLDNVEIDFVEDFDGIFHAVTCTICKADVTEEYDAKYPQEDEDYDAWREFEAEEGGDR